MFLNPIVELLLFCLYMSVIPIKYVYTNLLLTKFPYITQVRFIMVIQTTRTTPGLQVCNRLPVVITIITPKNRQKDKKNGRDDTKLTEYNQMKYYKMKIMTVMTIIYFSVFICKI